MKIGSADIIIIGGGIMGCSSTYNWQSGKLRGHKLRGQVFNLAVLRMCLILLVEFGWKGER
jgi:hypothetical protein